MALPFRQALPRYPILSNWAPTPLLAACSPQSFNYNLLHAKKLQEAAMKAVGRGPGRAG